MSVPTAETSAALAAVARFGPYFAVEPTPGPGWLPLSALAVRPELMAARVAETRERLAGSAGRPAAEIEPRVAGSTAHLGIAARLLSPVLAVAAEHGLVLDADPDRVSWWPVVGGAVPLSFPPVARRGRTDAELAELVDRLVLGPAVAPLLAATRRDAPVAVGLLWGNVASGLAGAARMIGSPAARSLVEALLERPRLAGTGGYAGDGFRRRSCCLFYRVAPDAGFCADCALTRA